MGAVELDYVVPAAAIAPYVTLFYHFRADLPRLEDTERADHAQLRFRLDGGGATYRFADGSLQSAPSVHLLGPTSGAFHVEADGPGEVFGFGITPAGWAAMIGIDASQMCDRCVDGIDLLGERVAEAAVALAAAPDLPTKVAVAERLVQALVRTYGGGLGAFAALVDDWLVTEPSPRLEELVGRSGLSRRQVERKCKAVYGVRPKLLARKYRALRAAAMLIADRISADDAVDHGFYDQSHLIRELKRFTGLTPGQLRARPGMLSQMTVERRRALSGQVARIISHS